MQKNSQFLGILKNKAAAPIAILQNEEKKEELELLDLNQKIHSMEANLQTSQGKSETSFLQKELEIYKNALSHLREAKKVPEK